MAMSVGPAGAEGDPMVEMNTTPLIDVMLVLLIMFIITLPPPTHAVKIDLPTPCEPNCPPPPVIKPTKNLLYVAPNDAILWNGQPMHISQLQGVLEATQTMQPIPELHLQPDAAARYEIVDKVMAATKRAKVSKMGSASESSTFRACNRESRCASSPTGGSCGSLGDRAVRVAGPGAVSGGDFEPTMPASAGSDRSASPRCTTAR